MRSSDYTLKDFIQDESFRNYVNKSVPDDVLKWELWLENNPEKRLLPNDAAAIISGITFTKKQAPWQKIDAGWQSLTREIAKSKNVALVTPAKWYQHRELWLLTAVWFGFLVVLFIGFYFHKKNSELRYETGFGETATIILPDKSTVILNSNSKLTFTNSWSSRKDREVWLQGEAFFSVLEKPGKRNARFLVHTGIMDIEVLGTKFNVNSRKARTCVVLSSGKIQLSAGEKNPAKLALMQPGEFAELTLNKRKFLKKKVNPLMYSSWIHKKLLFEETSIREIATLLEDNYGFQVKLIDSTLLDRKLTGEVYVEDVETLLKALSKSFQLEITQSSNILTIKGKNL